MWCWWLQELEMPATGRAMIIPAPSLLDSASKLTAGPFTHQLKLAIGWTVVIILVALAAWRHIAQERQVQHKQQKQLLLSSDRTKSADV